ncbi:Maf family protein [Domibacillus enclensis]|uniref:dTTP/UTP pyrophosphatase n=1 Tax=Domibacillus enclensis TaxID=1017273 RepID=A0A1N6PZQ5_9BACI|nr:Maf family protein [Domibacillus enclensis]OXS80535.1 septum formation inhibitor Maf [Domibacillus enclensis]SIQ09821.1 septum formation protein [Domibacillus enclensis]
MTRIILASSSPRRKELLSQVFIPFTIQAADADETIQPGTKPAEAVQQLALKKAAVVSAQNPDAAVIGADTVVVSEGRILGKPENEQDAKAMLLSLSGRTHAVYTGVAIITRHEQVVFFEKTDVEFWELTEADISAYLETGEPFDKAGGYGIQSAGALFVKAIHGDYFNVVGLPVSTLSRQLVQMGLLSSCFPSRS